MVSQDTFEQTLNDLKSPAKEIRLRAGHDLVAQLHSLKGHEWSRLWHDAGPIADPDQTSSQIDSKRHTVKSTSASAA